MHRTRSKDITHMDSNMLLLTGSEWACAAVSGKLAVPNFFLCLLICASGRLKDFLSAT
jgi:hypothetical protein